MALVRSISNVNIDEQDYLKYHRFKILAAKEILRILKVRLNLLIASRSTAPRQSNANLDSLTKLENALSLTVHEFQKSAFQHQMVELALEKSILSTLLYKLGKKLFESNDLNDIEQCVASYLKTILLQTPILQEKKLTSERQFNKILILRDEIAAISDSVVQKLSDEDTPASEEDAIRQKFMTKMIYINIISTLLTQMVVSRGSKDMLPLLGKWRTPRSYSYYQDLVE